MNRLSEAKRVQVISALVEGNSIRATIRMTGVAKDMVIKLLAEVGQACADYQRRTLCNLACQGGAQGCGVASILPAQIDSERPGEGAGGRRSQTGALESCCATKSIIKSSVVADRGDRKAVLPVRGCLA